MSWLTAIRALATYLRSPLGVPALLPCVLAVVSAWIDVLPLPEIVKPAISLVFLFAGVYGILIGMSLHRTMRATKDRMRSTALRFWGGVFLMLVHPGGLALLDDHLPRSAAAAKLVVWAWSLILVIGIAQVTIALTMLALRQHARTTDTA